MTSILAGLGRNAPALSGLNFPGNDGVTTTMRFSFTDPQDDGLPLRGTVGDGLTYIWKAKYAAQTGQPGYYTCFFYSDDSNWFDGGGKGDGYGFHPYPVDSNGDGDSTELNRQIHSIADGSDWPQGQSFWEDYLVAYDTWYTHVVRIDNQSSGDCDYNFYPDYEVDDTLLLTRNNTSTGAPVNPVLAWGDAPHSEGNEVMSGVLRDIRVYDTLLSLADIDLEIAAVTSSGTTPWYYKTNPTPTDIADESGNGNDPAWIGAERPTLWET